MNLTENEKKMLENIVKNNFASGGCQVSEAIWANCLDEGPNGEFVPKTSFPGIISSLSKKGLVYCEGKGKDAIVAITELGVKEYKSLKNMQSHL